jgi:hypothetical protein
LDGRPGDEELTIPDDAQSVIPQPLIYLITGSRSADALYGRQRDFSSAPGCARLGAVLNIRWCAVSGDRIPQRSTAHSPGVELITAGIPSHTRHPVLRHTDTETPENIASVVEFILEGAHLNKRLNKTKVEGKTVYRH